MRPVVSFVSSPTYALVKFLDRWFKSRVEFESPYSVKNSVSLADRLKDDILPPGSTLCSFDVVGLFPSILRATAMKHMGDLLVRSNICHEELAEFFSLLNICWFPNFCKFQGKFFEFPEEVGTPIGFPLGSLISEVFMSKFELDFFFVWPGAFGSYILLAQVRRRCVVYVDRSPRSPFGVSQVSQ